MERIRLLYEQLEEAKRLLLVGSLPQLRLALILLDNAVELISYRELREQFAMDDYSARLRQSLDHIAQEPDAFAPRYTEEERREAEREFEPMLKILAFRLGRISEQDRAILRICHKLRREAFHRGEINPAILGPVTELLFLTVVEVARKLPVHSFSVPGGPPRGENAAFLARFGIDRADELGMEEGKEKLRQVLSEGITCDAANFAEVLSSDLVVRIDSIVGGLSYLNNETDDRHELDHRLRYSQFWKERGAAIAQECSQQGRPWREDLESAYQQWSLNPGPRFTMEKLERWQREASAIARATRPADALVKYWAIEQRFVRLEDEVSQAVVEYDAYIDMLVHDRRH